MTNNCVGDLAIRIRIACILPELGVAMPLVATHAVLQSGRASAGGGRPPSSPRREDRLWEERRTAICPGPVPTGAQLGAARRWWRGPAALLATITPARKLQMAEVPMVANVRRA